MYLSYLTATLAITPLILSVAALPPVPPDSSSLTRDPNPYAGTSPFPIPKYAQELEETIQYFKDNNDSLNAARAKTVQSVLTFAWIAWSKDVGSLASLAKAALEKQTKTGQKQVVQVVVYNLPDRDCALKESGGEFHLDDDGLNKYYGFIDSIAAQLDTAEAKEVDFVVVLEPDSLGNVITSLTVPKCAGAAGAYRAGISYAIAKLYRPNVSLYLDATHGGWLGWDANLAPTASLFSSVLTGAQKLNKDAQVRGLVTSVSNYNQYIAPIRENFTIGNNAWDEWHFVNRLAPHLEKAGYPAHFIVDQGRAGRAGIRTEWSQWCNVRNAGFGIRPTTDQGPPGESDGASSAGFDDCDGPVAHVPAPEAGEWFNAYAVNLVLNANPPLDPTV
ncbi:cellobiohydrolase [Coprinopsis sp. MPI-PUGE-AT-0042]|nr:cellobiohydrolase [Coprinopsis sp. MPI-PUGE-AT-0042]